MELTGLLLVGFLPCRHFRGWEKLALNKFYSSIFQGLELSYLLLPLFFSRLVMSDSLQPHGLQHARLPCPSPTPGACSNSCPLIVMSSNHLILCRLLLLLPSIFPSIRVFSNELALPIRWPKYWSFSFTPSNEYSGLISFRMD